MPPIDQNAGTRKYSLMKTRRVLQTISVLALLCVAIAPAIYMSNRISLDAMKWWLLGATIVWFLVTPFWMQQKREE